MTFIKVEINEDGYISVWNDGKGIIDFIFCAFSKIFNIKVTKRTKFT